MTSNMSSSDMEDIQKTYSEREFLYMSEVIRLQQEYQRLRQSVPHSALYGGQPGAEEEFDVLRPDGHLFRSVSDPWANLEVKELRLLLGKKDAEIRALKDQLEDRRGYHKDSEQAKHFMRKCIRLNNENKDLEKALVDNKTPRNDNRFQQQQVLDNQRQALRDLWKNYVHEAEEADNKMEEKTDELHAAFAENQWLRKEIHKARRNQRRIR
eukprot:Selendium_serpulae@DN6356_c0_g1_i6.p1